MKSLPNNFHFWHSLFVCRSIRDNLHLRHKSRTCVGLNNLLLFNWNNFTYDEIIEIYKNVKKDIFISIYYTITGIILNIAK